MKRLISPSSPFIHLLVLLLLIALMTLISSIVMMLIANLFGISMGQLPQVINNPDESDILFLKILQAVQTIFMFLVPALLFPFVIKHNFTRYLQVEITRQRILWVLTPLFIISMIPVINWLAALNSQMDLPASLDGIEKWMADKEKYATNLLDKLLRTDNTAQLVGNILLIAVLPAIAEEFLFRGALQRVFIRLTNNIHAGIIVTAIVFSAIHMQFFGFVPRFLLGLVFGYFMIWTGSIWLPVLAHFTNNFLGVLYYHFYQGEIHEGYFDTIGATNETIPILILSFLVSGFIMYVIYQKSEPFRVR
ncbi:MAG: CPBP family intramembrane metalloprotease [Bacteroidetes bacterium]|nr:CPBP family intramembrane metalloprotease [Bacteroidota bacterium]